MLSSSVFAADIADTDILARTINFVIFASLIYYFVGDKAKAFFKERSDGIKSELQKVQDRLKETKIAKQNADKKVEDAKKLATEILATSKKENKLLSEKVDAQMVLDLKSLENSHQTLLAFDQRDMVTSVVDEIMSDVLSDKNIPLDNDAITDIILKKVA